MKCKYRWRELWQGGISGLIEAYWNVNVNELNRTIAALDGLIEAYWNVNHD